MDNFLNQSLAHIFTSDEHWQNIHILLPPFDETTDLGRSLTDEEKKALKEVADKLTIRSLLTHSSGLARGLEVSPLFNQDQVGVHSYSNLGYQLLGEVIKVVSKELFTSYVSNHILKPAGVEHGGFAETYQGCESLISGIQPLDEKRLHNLKPPDGAGGFNLTATELLKVGKTIFDGQLFTKLETLDALLSNRVSIDQKSKYYASGIEITETDRGCKFSHGGANGYIQTDLIMYQKQGHYLPYYISVLNVCGGELGHHVAMNILEMIDIANPSKFPNELCYNQRLFQTVANSTPDEVKQSLDQVNSNLYLWHQIFMAISKMEQTKSINEKKLMLGQKLVEVAMSKTEPVFHPISDVAETFKCIETNEGKEMALSYFKFLLKKDPNAPKDYLSKQIDELTAVTTL